MACLHYLSPDEDGAIGGDTLLVVVIGIRQPGGEVCFVLRKIEEKRGLVTMPSRGDLQENLSNEKARAN